MFSPSRNPAPQLLKIIPEKKKQRKLHQELRYPLKMRYPLKPLPRLPLHQGCLNRNSLLSLVNPSRTFQQWLMGMLMMSGHLNQRSIPRIGAHSIWGGA
jgi:hypothetical protein